MHTRGMGSECSVVSGDCSVSRRRGGWSRAVDGVWSPAGPLVSGFPPPEPRRWQAKQPGAALPPFNTKDLSFLRHGESEWTQLGVPIWMSNKTDAFLKKSVFAKSCALVMTVLKKTRRRVIELGILEQTAAYTVLAIRHTNNWPCIWKFSSNRSAMRGIGFAAF